MRYTINTQISRPDSALVNRFAHLAVPDICDALGRNAALPSSIKPLNCTRILGIAYTPPVRISFFIMLQKKRSPVMSSLLPVQGTQNAP